MDQTKEESFTNARSNHHVTSSNGLMHRDRTLHMVDHDQELKHQHLEAAIKTHHEILEMMEATTVNVSIKSFMGFFSAFFIKLSLLFQLENADVEIANKKVTLVLNAQDLIHSTSNLQWNKNQFRTDQYSQELYS